MKVNEYFSIRAHHPLVLVICIHLAAIYAPIEKGLTLVLHLGVIDQSLELLHEKLACQFIPFVNKFI